jgi:hypothetical protein
LTISEGYGRKRCRFFVNSAQAWSRDRVDEKFGPEAAADGSVPLGFIETLVSESADLVGRWAIRAHIRARGYSRRTTQKIMSTCPMLTTANGVPYTWSELLDLYLDVRDKTIREGQLQRAAALRQRGSPRPVELTSARLIHISGPCSDD